MMPLNFALSPDKVQRNDRQSNGKSGTDEVIAGDMKADIVVDHGAPGKYGAAEIRVAADVGVGASRIRICRPVFIC